VSDPLKDLFTQMDSVDEDTALAAMRDASALLRSKGLDFGRVVERLEHSLLPLRIASTLKMLDGSTHEAANAFRAARTLLKGNGLSFAAIARALAHASHPAEIDRLNRALADAQAMGEHYATEARRLRLQVSQRRTRAVPHVGLANPWKQWIAIGALSLMCLWVWSPAFSRHSETAATASVAGPLWRLDSGERRANSSPPAPCWRDRSISGQCF
jgi:hypothetical protein